MDLFSSVVFCLLVFVLVCGLVGMFVVRNIEKKEWNNGVCPKCGNDFKLIDGDSQGGRMYRCDNWHACCVSYNVDKRKNK